MTFSEHALARELDRMRAAQLMRREAPAYARPHRASAQGRARG
jgi:hypothetical protein